MLRQSEIDLVQIRKEFDEKLEQARQAMITANINLAQDRWDELISFALSQNHPEADLPIAPLFYERAQWHYLIAKGYYDTDSRDLDLSTISIKKAITDFSETIERTRDKDLQRKTHHARAKAYSILLKTNREAMRSGSHNYEYSEGLQKEYLWAAVSDYLECLAINIDVDFDGNKLAELKALIEENEADKNYSVIRLALQKVPTNKMATIFAFNKYFFRFFLGDEIVKIIKEGKTRYFIIEEHEKEALFPILMMESKIGNSNDFYEVVIKYIKNMNGLAYARLLHLFNPYSDHIKLIMGRNWTPLLPVIKTINNIHCEIPILLRCIAKYSSLISTSTDDQQEFISHKKAIIDRLYLLDPRYKDIPESEWCDPVEMPRIPRAIPDDSVMIHYKAGMHSASKSKCEDAIAHFSTALYGLYDPRVALIYRERAKAYCVLGEYEEAILDYEKAIEACPHSLVLHEELGLWLESFWQFDKAKAVYERGLSREINPKHKHEFFGINVLVGDKKTYETMVYRLVDLYRGHKQYAEAKRWLNVIREDNKENVRYLLSLIAVDEKDMQTAIGFYIEEIKLEDDDAYEKLLDLIKTTKEQDFANIDIQKLIEDIKTLDEDKRIPLLVLCFNPDIGLGKKLGAKKGQKIETLSETLQSLYAYIIAIDQTSQDCIDAFMYKSEKRLATSSVKSEKVEANKAISLEEKARSYYDRAEKNKALLNQISTITDPHNRHNGGYKEKYIIDLRSIISDYVSAFSLCPSQKIVNGLREVLDEKQENELYENSYYTAIAQMDVNEIGVYLCQMDVSFYRLFSARAVQTIIKQNPHIPSTKKNSYEYFITGLEAENKQNFDVAMRWYSICTDEWGVIAYARLLHLFRCNEPTYRKKLDAVLKDKDEEDILKLIQNIRPIEYQTPFLLQCLNKETALGKRLYTKGFLEWRDRSLEEGILKKVWDCLYKINPDAALAIKGKHPVAVININLAVQTSLDLFSRGKRAGSCCDYYYDNDKQIKERPEKKQALGYYHLTIALNPRHAAVHYELGMLAAEEGQYNRAISSFRLAIQCDGNNALYHYELAYAYMKIGRFKSAIAHVNQAIQLLESDSFGLDEASTKKLGVFYYVRGQLKQKLDMHEEAIKDFDHAITLYSPTDDSFSIKKGLGRCYLAKGQSKQQSNNFDEAIADYKEALNLIDRWKWDLIAINRFHLAQCYEAKEEYALAVDNYFCAIHCNKNQEAFPCLIALFNKIDASDLSPLGNGLLITKMKACKKKERAILFLQCFDPTSALGKKMGAKEGQTLETLNDDLTRIYEEMLKLDVGYLKTLSQFVDISKTLESDAYKKTCLNKKLLSSLGKKKLFYFSPYYIFDKIKTFDENEQAALLLQCYDPNTDLGKRMGIKFGGNHLDKGILKDIYDYLINISDYYAHVLEHSEVKEVKEMAQQTITASLQKTKEKEEARDRQRKQEKEVCFLDRSLGKQRAKQSEQAGKEQEKRRDSDDNRIYPL